MTYFDADRHGSRTMLRRAELLKTHDDGDLQLVDVEGHDVGDKPTKVHRVQPFGLSSHAPAGSHGILGALGGRPDQPILLGIESAEHRPRDLPEGATRLYDAADGFVYLDSDGNLHAKVDKGAMIEAGETVNITAPNVIITGNLTITGDITHAGNMTTSGVHVDASGPHTAS